jgi:hypothetical protein
LKRTSLLYPFSLGSFFSKKETNMFIESLGKIKQNLPYKTIPTKIQVVSKKKSKGNKPIKVWRNVNLITAPTIIIKSVYNEKNKRYDRYKKITYEPNPTLIKTTKDLAYCGRGSG